MRWRRRFRTGLSTGTRDGGDPLEAPADMRYGDRRATAQDTRGNVWQIATHQRDLSADEVRSRLGGGR